MSHDAITAIRRRPDGTLDIDHYVARGRHARAVQARDMARRAKDRALGDKPLKTNEKHQKGFSGLLSRLSGMRRLTT